MRRPLFALLGVFVVVGAAVGPAAAAATQTGDGTDDGTTAGNAPVADGNGTFGQQVSTLVQALQQSGSDMGIGQVVSSFAVANNPGNAPAFAGGPGGPNATGNETTRGPPSFVQAMFGGGNATAGDRRGPPENVTGPPAHAGGPDDGNETDADGNETMADGNQTAADGNETVGGERGPPGDGERGPAGGERGPPDDAGPSGGPGNGQGPGGPGADAR